MRFGFKQLLVGEKRCVTTLITAAWLLQHNNLFVQFRASERERKQLSLLRQRVFQEELFFTLRKALAM